MPEQESSQGPDSSDPLLTKKELFRLWLVKLEHEATDSIDLNLYTRFAYLSTVHAAAMEMQARRDLNMMDQPLNEVLNILDTAAAGEEPLYGEDVVEGCAVTAQVWASDHPDSPRARLIAEQGTQAAFGHHIGLLLEMFLDYHQSHAP